MPIIHEERFRAWEACAPPCVREGPMWKFHAHRVALYLADLASDDVAAIRSRHPGSRQADHLSRAMRTVSANVAEALASSSPAERVRLLGVALDGVRECVARYRAVQAHLDEDLCALRFDQLAEVSRIVASAQKWLSPRSARFPVP